MVYVRIFNTFCQVHSVSGIGSLNFDTLFSSIIVVFDFTSVDWDLISDPLTDKEKAFKKPDTANGIKGTCGNRSIAIFYFVSYVIITYLIIINIYIAVILENYSQAIEDVQEGRTDDD